MMLKNHFLDHYHDEDDDDEVSPWILNGMLRSDKLEACLRKRELGMRPGREKGWWPGHAPKSHAEGEVFGKLNITDQEGSGCLTV